jgi:hypothetical protein
MKEVKDLKDLIKSATIKELALYYDVTFKTMRAWLTPHEEYIGPIVGRCYTPRQVILIIKKLGPPKSVEIPNEYLLQLYALVA